MYAKGKGPQMATAEIQAKEKLALYVYEYLMHLGAKNSAQTFLQEIRWEKNINVGEAPGFLVSWWSVFWDLYCAASPDRREQFEPSNEAKAFHEYSQPNVQPINAQIMPNNNQPYQRYAAPRGIRMQPNIDFNANQNPNATNQLSNEQSRVPAGMSPISRLTPPGNRMPVQQQVQQQQQAQNQMPNQNQMGGFNPGMNNQNAVLRPPNTINQQNQPMSNPTQQQIQQQQQQQQQQQISNAPMSPMSMSMQQPQQQQQPRWNTANQNQAALPPPPPPPHTMNYSSPSPVSYVTPTGGNNANLPIGHHGPSTPIIPSPQDSSGELNFNLINVKNVNSGSIQVHEQNINHIVPLNSESAHHQYINSDIIDSIKHSPLSNLSGRHQEDHSNSAPLNDLNAFNHFGDGGGVSGLF